MARRSNFIEGNDNFREQNLRFVRNEFEDNINQFFGGANPGGGSGQQKPPPRDSLIVQPTPGGAPPEHLESGRNFDLDTRRQFIRELGASRMAAHALAVRTLKVPDFDLRYYQRQRFRLSVELGDSRQNVVDAEVLRAIGEALENKEPDLESRPRTPSPPRNIDWHNINRANSPGRNNDRSRQRNRQGADDFRGNRDNSRGFVKQQEPKRDREPFNRNTGPKNAPTNRYNRNLSNDNRNANPDEFNRNNRNMNADEFSRNNRNANPQEIIRNNRSEITQEFNRGNRNSNEFNRGNRNIDEFNRNNRNLNAQQEFHRGNQIANPQIEFNENPEMNRNIRNVNPQAINRNQQPREAFRNNRNGSNDDFNRNNRNDNRQEMNQNNRNANLPELNRNANPQEFNRNLNPQGKRNPQLNPREMPSNLNRNANHKGNPNFRAPQSNSRKIPQNFNNPPFNNNYNNHGPPHGPADDDLMSNQPGHLDRNSMIDQSREIDNNFLESRYRPQSHSDFRQLQTNLAGNAGPNQVGRNYQRIVNNNQITLCRSDLIEANRRELDNGNPDNFGPNYRNLNENFRGQRSREFEDQDQGYEDHFMEDDDTFRRPEQQLDDFRRPGFQGPEDQGFLRSSNNRIDRNFEGNQENFRDQRNNDSNYHGRGRNERRQFNDDDDRARSNDSVTFRGDVSPNLYQRRSGSGDRHQPANRNQNRANQGRNAPHPRQATTSQDRTMARNNYSSGRNQRETSKTSQDRNSVRNTSTGGPRSNQDRIPRSTALASQSRSTSRQDRSSSRSVKPGDANLKKQTAPAQRTNIKSGVPPNNRGSTQTKPKPSASDIKIANSGASKASTSRKNASLEQTNKRAGQKRKAETKESESEAPANRSSKAGNKRIKITASDCSFIIGGFSMPYMNNNKKKLPQSEDESYAVTFFEQTPIYNTNIYASDDGHIDDDDEEEEESDAESVQSNESGALSIKGKKLNAKKHIQTKLGKEWTAIYRKNNYKDWCAWWKDYKWCGYEINKELEKFGDRSVRHRFITKRPTTEAMVGEVFRCGRNGLRKNTFTHYTNMRSIFLLMNESFLEALSEEQKKELQDLIRGIPNHLWVYKVRSMVYLWERYRRAVKTLGESKMHKENELKDIKREWRNPAFHWLAKQAFDELQAISGIAWFDHKEIYPSIS